MWRKYRPLYYEKRVSREGLSEEELAVFDLLTQPTPKLTRAQEIEAKRVAKSLLATLQRDRLVQNWRMKAQTRAAVRTTIREVLNELPEEPYPKDLWDQKVDLTYLYVFEHFPGSGLGGASAMVH
jgi:type I restriction enzyme, R subunit